MDTNVLVAAFATRGLCEDVLQVVLAEHHLLVGETILDEFKRVLGEKLRMPDRQVEEAVLFIREQSELVSSATPATWPESDPDDQWVVAAAIDGDADFVITGDKDLLRERGKEEFQVISPRGFWDLLHNPP